METIRNRYIKFQEWFQGLTERERRLVMVAGVTVTAFALFFVLYSLSTGAAVRERRIAHKAQMLQEIESLGGNYRQAERERQATERQLSGTGISLISFLEEKGAAAGMEIRTMNPKGEISIGDGKILENSVELTLSDIVLSKLVLFLNSVETGPGVVKVKLLRLEPHLDGGTLTAFVTIATYRIK